MKQALEAVIDEAETHDVSMGVRVVDLQRDQLILDHGEDEVHYAASVNKNLVALGVRTALWGGQLVLGQELDWSDHPEIRQLSQYGRYDWPGAETHATVDQLLEDMLQRSGNTAPRVLVPAVGGVRHVNEQLPAFVPGGDVTQLEPLEGDAFYMGNTTAAEALAVLRALLEEPSEFNQRMACALMRRALEQNAFGDFGVRAALGNVGLTLANKVGILNDSAGNNRHDVGMVYDSVTGAPRLGYALLTTTHTEAATTKAEATLTAAGAVILDAA